MSKKIFTGFMFWVLSSVAIGGNIDTVTNTQVLIMPVSYSLSDVSDPVHAAAIKFCGER